MATKSLSIRIQEEMLDKLHVVADYEGRSANSQILILILRITECRINLGSLIIALCQFIAVVDADGVVRQRVLQIADGAPYPWQKGRRRIRSRAQRWFRLRRL